MVSNGRLTAGCYFLTEWSKNHCSRQQVLSQLIQATLDLVDILPGVNARGFLT
jgi:hypothetical protein